LSLILLHRLGSHRALRSFPTRRSSDLAEPVSERMPLQPLIYTEFPNLTPEAAAVRERRLMRQLTEGAGGGGQWGDLEVASSESRSEEHTSELQSRENLVCRLLLEKKKE